MLTKHISGLPVLDKEGRLVGIVTEGDFLRRAETGGETEGRSLGVGSFNLDRL
jgi:CBS domain-containing protein